MFLPSFTEENLIFEKEFSSYFKYGLNIQTTSNLDEDTKLKNTISLFPMKMIPIMRNGKPALSKTNTTEMNLSYSKENENGKVNFMLGSKNQFLVNIKPSPPLSLTAALSKSGDNFQPLLDFSYATKYFHPTFRITLSKQPLISIENNTFQFFQADQVEMIDFSSTFGKKDCSFGIQIQRQFVRNTRIGTLKVNHFSLLWQKKWNKNAVEIAYVHNILYKSQFLWRYMKEINKNWRAGVAYAIDDKLYSFAHAFYSCNIGKARVYGTINTEGNVLSYFSLKLSDNFSLGIGGQLQHSLKDYKLGIILDFNQ